MKKSVVESDKNNKNRTFFKWLLREIKFFAGMTCLMLVFLTTVWGHYKIPSESMQPTLEVGDHLYVSKFAYGYSRHSMVFNLHKLPFLKNGKLFSKLPKRGDVAVFRNPKSDIIMIKRVVGLPGDKIFLNEGRLYINEQLVKRKNTEEIAINVPVQENITQKIQEEISVQEVSPQQQLPLESTKTEKSASFKIPPIKLLDDPVKIENQLDEESYKTQSKFLENVLLDFSISGEIKRVSAGPVVTLYEFEPTAGIKTSKIINLSEDIARNTSSISTRVATVPGKSTIGIEIPNKVRENVALKEIISSKEFNNKDIKIPITLGKSISGFPIVGDLVSMPHLLIAGTTGSGKSVCINTLILSILYRHKPDDCKLIMIDPKMLELSIYQGIPHLLTPVITEPKKATTALKWVVKEMEKRYREMTEIGVRNISGFNDKASSESKKKMPYIVVIVDEMADLMMIAGKEIENYIQRLAQMARAAGIHIVMATQRPSVDVITGTIKANFPTRISFQVTSKIDSRTILGEQGAELLLGNGDMLFMSSASRIIRIHGPYVSEKEIERVSTFLRLQGSPTYIEEVTRIEEQENDEVVLNSEGKDELYNKAVEIIKTEGKASTSFLQRKLGIGYNRAARIIDQMEEEKIISPANHVGKREIY